MLNLVLKWNKEEDQIHLQTPPNPKINEMHINIFILAYPILIIILQSFIQQFHNYYLICTHIAKSKSYTYFYHYYLITYLYVKIIKF